MSGSVEFGRCDICKKEDILQRKYYYYGILCECHSPYHFEIVHHCKDCEPKEPLITNVRLKTTTLKDLAIIYSRKNKLKKLGRL